jgi:hypothetical protein
LQHSIGISQTRKHVQVIIARYLSPFEAREVIVQAGAFGEHQFTKVKYQVRSDPEALQPDHFTRPSFRLADRTANVNRKFFAVRLAPGTGLTLEMGITRFANRPGYVFPWHGDTIPVQ